MTRGYRDCFPLITNEESNLGSLKLVFLIKFWKLTKYQYFRAKSCRIQQPYTKISKIRLNIWGKTDTSLKTCLVVFVIVQNTSKKGFCVDGQVTPYKIWSTHFQIRQPYTKNIKKWDWVFGKKFTRHYKPFSLCLSWSKTRPKKVFVWTVKWPLYKKLFVGMTFAVHYILTRNVLIVFKGWQLHAFSP